MKKTSILIVLIFAMILCTGCRDFKKDRNLTRGITGDYQAEITGLRVENKDSDMPLMYIKFAFTNRSSESISLKEALDPTAYQDDMILESIKEKDLTASEDAPIEPGSTHEMEMAYILHDGNNKRITVEITNHKTGEKLVRTMETL